jgi:signal transduction histidine kinase
LRDELDAATPQQHREIIHRMNINAQDLAQTVENVMDFAVSGAKAESPRRELVDLRDLVAEIAPAIEAANHSKRLDLRCAIDESVRTVALRRRPLKSILLNLAINAVKFTEHGSISISFKPFEDKDRGRCLEVAVADTGPGIERGRLAQAFRACTQLSNTSARFHRGIGLGLAVVKRNVRAIGARLIVNSAPNKGTTFVVRIPLADRARCDGRRPQGSLPLAPRALETAR